VFIEAIFRPIERLVNGPRNVALRRAGGPADLDRAARLAATHALYLVASFLVAHVFLAYFVSLPALWRMMTTHPGAHPEAFGWMLATTALTYGAFAVFREQFCVVMCPYGRLQSVLLDDDALVIGYDERRGEPRGKTTAEDRGACVDCNRCVVVCPTGIDIREGLQLDCIACTACVDACDEVMDRLGRPRGLVRYDSLHGLRGEPRHVLRPRIVVYTALLVVGIVVAALAIGRREPFEANLLRLPGPPYTIEEGRVRNGFELHVVNKTSAPATFTLSAEREPGVELIIPITEVEIEPLGSRRLPFFVVLDRAAPRRERPLVVHVASGAVVRDVRAPILSPGGGRP
jgi:cytochrome c oxidase accessory protein FixG